MWTRTRYSLAALLIGTAAIGCQSTGDEASSEYEALQDASRAYQAYERGDCKTVQLLSEPLELKDWQSTEVRDSTMLLHGFCSELAGDPEAAQDIYERLIEESPRSFAAMDAKERARILRINKSDPTHAAWMRDARDRALEADNQPTRAPVERQSAQFPPIARTVGVEGYVVLEFGITPRGKTSDPIVVDSQPPLLFDGSAIRAVRRWKYAQGGSSSANDLQVIRLVFKTEDGGAGADDATAAAKDRSKSPEADSPDAAPAAASPSESTEADPTSEPNANE